MLILYITSFEILFDFKWFNKLSISANTSVSLNLSETGFLGPKGNISRTYHGSCKSLLNNFTVS